MQLKKELVYREFVQRENNLLRAPYNPEVSFYTAIKEGDVAKVEQLCQESLLDKEGLGTLSDHYLPPSFRMVSSSHSTMANSISCISRC